MGVLDGKVAFITGAGTGIGRGTAQLFAAEGAKVVIAARREGPLRDAAALAPGKISYVQMDLKSQADRHRALQTVMERHGRLDILVNNAANQYYGPFIEMTEDDIADTFLTNLTATASLIHRAIPLLRETKGNIVNISSTAGRFAPVPGQLMVAYSATRGGINQLTRTLAAELGPMGIRINAVAPGLTHGEVSDAKLLGKPDAPLDALRSVTALGRIGEPADIARVILFMASDQAAWVTGQILDASGGWQIGGG
ncbi:MAG: SDR family oxidoreductase [Rhodospirillaceae bacterium]|nr:MAG: SDR family oxidoreductase [Rhodospirillaceae bacterium]